MERGKSEIWAVPLLAGFSGEVGGLSAPLETVDLAAGEWLYREGELADSAYLVRSGRIDMVAERPTETVLRQIKRGSLVGELGLLMHGVRTASARASRDTELARLNRQQFEELVLGSPGFTLGLLRSMAEQIAANRAPISGVGEAATIAVVALDPGAPAPAIGDALVRALAAYRRVECVGPDPDRPRDEYRRVLRRAELGHDHVVFATTSPVGSDDWTDFCLREADVVIAISSGPASNVCRPDLLRGCELIVVDAALDAELDALLAPREVQVVRGESALAASVAQTARRLAGRSVGLVLSGGGARALAHLGVLQELERSGIEIDRYGGASMGAIVSALAARGTGSDEIIEMCQRLMLDHNPSSDYTVPAYSLIRGVRTRTALSAVFAGQRIEELPRRWYCVASDLVARELLVRRTGPIADAVYSSMALPGIYPPIHTDDGRVLIDGGVMDNLPVEPMARRGEGPIIAVDVSQRLGLPHSPPRVGLARVARAARRVLTGSERPIPTLRETIHWTIALGSRDTVTAGIRHADLVITPHVEGIGILDWKQLPKAVEVGRRAAHEAIEAALPLIESWKASTAAAQPAVH